MDNQIRQYLNERHVDVEAGLKVLEGVPDSEALYLRLLRMFAQDDNYALFQEALAGGDLETAQRSSHALKGTSGNLGMRALHEASTAVNNTLKEGQRPDKKAVKLLNWEYGLVQEAIAGLESFNDE